MYMCAWQKESYVFLFFCLSFFLLCFLVFLSGDLSFFDCLVFHFGTVNLHLVGGWLGMGWDFVMIFFFEIFDVKNFYNWWHLVVDQVLPSVGSSQEAVLLSVWEDEIDFC